MKELSIEQKAKRYDEAIEIARQYYNDRAMPIGTNFKLERMFPELKESEDEKIRKELISFVRGMLACHDKPNAERDEKYESWIAWLEKQAEQKHTPKHKIGDTIYYNSFGEVKSMVVSDVAIDGTDNPMYEDKEGNAVFEKDLIEHNLAEWHREDEQNLNAWTEGDEKQARQIERIVHNDDCSKKLQEQIANWFKSLKYRVQPKQEWNEEDERNASYICAALDCYYRLREDRNNTNGQENLDKARNWLYNRLKSLRPQNSSVTDEELAQAKKDAYNEALDKIEYHSGEPTFDDGWDAAIWYLKKRNTKGYE